MTPNSPNANASELLSGLDRAVEAHLAWNQRLLRCSLLRESPGDDMLRPNAHELCKFGVWFDALRPKLEEYDATMVARIHDAHVAMHRAVAAMCGNALTGTAALATDLAAFEHHQSDMVHGLNELRQGIAERAAHQDVLTGLPLRHGLEHSYDMRSKDSRRSGQALWLVMIDVDRFKSVNDRYGHSVGDQALRHVAQALCASLRDNDTLIRFGGEEFLGLFSISESEGVSIIAQRLIDVLRANPLDAEPGIVVPLTATMGWAKVRPGEALSSAVERADHALLHGKMHGRNQFVLAMD
jgi:diguanylate cyclase (GGDEF)-like protein